MQHFELQTSLSTLAFLQTDRFAATAMLDDGNDRVNGIVERVAFSFIKNVLIFLSCKGHLCEVYTDQT